MLKKDRNALSTISQVLAKWPGPITLIAIAQLFGTSLWFSINGVMDDLQTAWTLNATELGWLTSAVQLGFISGTLFLSLTNLADRFNASHTFLLSCISGAFFNSIFTWLSAPYPVVWIFRFCVGLSLAGIYPIGMKLIVSWSKDSQGLALSYLVGMLTLGTASPFGLSFLSSGLNWQFVINFSSLLALTAGLFIFLLGEGPHLKIQRTDHIQHGTTVSRVIDAFRNKRFRAASMGYFGHMWELYSFWTIVPLYIAHMQLSQALGVANTALVFFVIAAGAMGCVIGGQLSRVLGNAFIALTSLAISGLSCFLLLLSLIIGIYLPPILVFSILIIWGATVVADSPQFSAISVQTCPKGLIGSALAVQNAIGFFITVISIALTSYAYENIGMFSVTVLLLGPIMGLSGYFISIKK